MHVTPISKLTICLKWQSAHLVPLRCDATWKYDAAAVLVAEWSVQTWAGIRGEDTITTSAAHHKEGIFRGSQRKGMDMRDVARLAAPVHVITRRMFARAHMKRTPTQTHSMRMDAHGTHYACERKLGVRASSTLTTSSSAPCTVASSRRTATRPPLRLGCSTSWYGRAV